MLKNLVLCLATALVLAPTPANAQYGQRRSPGGSSSSGMDWGGVQLGQPASDLEKLAKKRRRKLIGPGKTMLDMEKQIMAGCYRVDGRTLGQVSGVRSQTIYVLNDKIVAVEFDFKVKSYYETFLRTLLKNGYEEQGESQYVGKLSSGPYKGKTVNVKATVVDAKRTRDRRYIVQARCLGVVEGDVAADGEAPAAGQGADAEKAVRGAL